MLLLVLFSTIVLAYGQHTFQQIYKNLNQSISACDDFYDHVCSSQSDLQKLFRPAALKREKELLAPLYPTEYHQLKKLFESDLEKCKQSSKHKFVDTLNTRCQNDGLYLEQYKDMMLMINGKSALNNAWEKMDCAKRSGAMSGVINDLDTMKATASAHKILEEIGKVAAWERHFEQKKDEMSHKEKQLKDMLNEFKGLLVKSIKSSTHLRAANQPIDQLISAVNKATIMEWRPAGMLKSAKRALDKYKECIDKRVTGLYASEVEMCFAFVLDDTKERMDPEALYLIESIGNFDAIYKRLYDRVDVLLTVYSALDKELSINTVATVGRILAHELGHAISDRKTIPACVHEGMTESCGLFSQDPSCTSGNNTANEDAPDMISMRLLLDKMIKNKQYDGYLKKMNKDLKAKLNVNQVLFYNYAWSFCTNEVKPSDKMHSSAKLRVNGILRMFPEFAKEFKCKPKQKMVAEKKCSFTGK